jgi:casein kinase 1
MNYVRKLGFEETPDYDFLRELFTKVCKNLGEVEDGVYDWMLLNGGKGWESLQNSGSHSQHQARDPHRPRERQHRASQQAQLQASTGGPASPSPAAVRDSQRARRVPSALQPGGGLTPTNMQGPNSAVAQVGVGAPTPSHRASIAQVNDVLAKTQHPYANTSSAVHIPSERVGMDSSNPAIVKQDDYNGTGYGGHLAPANGPGTPVMSQTRQLAADTGVHQNGGMHGGQLEDERPRRGFLDFLLCRCG